MIVSCRFGDIETMIDTEDNGFIPEVAGHLLARCSEAVLNMYAAMPDDAPTSDE